MNLIKNALWLVMGMAVVATYFLEKQNDGLFSFDDGSIYAPIIMTFCSGALSVLIYFINRQEPPKKIGEEGSI